MSTVQIPITGGGVVQVIDRVREATSTSGTGTVTLDGPQSSFQSFGAVGDGNQCYYCIADPLSDTWEVGIGTYTLSGTTLSRDTVLASSNSGILVDFSATSKDVFLTCPAQQLLRLPYPIADHFVDAPSGLTETDLYSDTLAADTLAVDGDKVTALYACTLVFSTSTKQVRVYFGGSAIFDTGALTVSAAGSLVIPVTIIRESATVVRYAISATTKAASTTEFAVVGRLTGLTLSSSNVLKITGLTAGVASASGDIVATMGTIARVPGA